MTRISLVAIQDWFAGRLDKIVGELLMPAISPTKDDRILDIGGGTGRLARVLAEKCGEVWVLEPEKSRLRYGREKRKNVKFMEGTAELMPFENEYFNKAIAIVSLHHFREPDKALSETRRVLKQNGLLAILEIDPGTIQGKVVNFFENTLGNSGCTFYAPSTLKRKIMECGFGEMVIMQTRIGYLVTARAISGPYEYTSVSL